MNVSRVTQKHKNLVCNWCHKKGHIRVDCLIHKKEKNNKLIPLNWLKWMKISVTFYLLQTDRSVTKIDGLVTLDVHSISVPIKRYSPHWFKGERSSWEILLRAR